MSKGLARFLVFALLALAPALTMCQTREETYHIYISTGNAPSDSKHSGTKDNVKVEFWGPFSIGGQGCVAIFDHMDQDVGGSPKHNHIITPGTTVGFPPEKIVISKTGKDDVFIEWIKIVRDGWSQWDDANFFTCYPKRWLSEDNSIGVLSFTAYDHTPDITVSPENKVGYTANVAPTWRELLSGILKYRTTVKIEKYGSESYSKDTQTDESFNTSLRVKYQNPTVRVDFNSNYSWRQQVDEQVHTSMGYSESGSFSEEQEITKPDDVAGMLVQPVVFTKVQNGIVTRGQLKFETEGPLSTSTNYHCITWGGTKAPNKNDDHYKTKTEAETAMKAFRTAVTMDPGKWLTGSGATQSGKSLKVQPSKFAKVTKALSKVN